MTNFLEKMQDFFFMDFFGHPKSSGVIFTKITPFLVVFLFFSELSEFSNVVIFWLTSLKSKEFHVIGILQ